MGRITISKKELKELYEKKKMTSYEIADFYGCCQCTVWKRLKEFGIKRLPNGRKTVVISKTKLRDLYIRQKLSSRKIAKIYGCAYSTIDSKIRKYGFPIKTLAAAHITTHRKDFDGNKTDKAYLIGFAMGDLRARKMYPNSETINIDCGSTKQEQIDLIYKLFKPYGRVWISNKPNQNGATQIECSVNFSFDFLLKKRDLIDDWVLKNKRFFWAFVAGFSDAEGCIAISNKNSAYYSLGNYNRELLEQIRSFLCKNKVICSKLHESKTKGKICFEKYFHNQNYWQLSICRKESLFLFLNSVEPYVKHAQKQRALQQAKDNILLRNRLFGNINWNYA